MGTLQQAFYLSSHSNTNCHLRQAFYDLDLERSAANAMVNKYIKPLVAEWSGVRGLELTAFYGVREYPEGGPFDSKSCRTYDN